MPYARLARVLAVLTTILAAADVAVTATYRKVLSEQSVAVHGFPFLTGAVVLSGWLGAVIVSRYERHPIGWLLCLIGLTGAMSVLGEAYNIWVLHEGGPGPVALAGVAGWSSALLSGQASIGGIALILLLAPDGRLLSRRWVVVPWLVVVGELVFAAGMTTGGVRTFDFESASFGTAGGILASIGFSLIMVALLSGTVSMLIRLRRSDGTRRQQLRLVAVGPLLVLAGVTNLIVGQSLNGGHQTFAKAVPLFAAFFLLPVLHTVAVLRYRLHDVDVFINAAVLVTVATAFAAGGYVAVVVLVGDQVDSRAGGWWLSLAGTAAVAVAFQPLRRWVVHLANRLAYGPRARPYVALSDFSSRLVAAPLPRTLLPAVADAAGRAVSAQGAVVTLDVPGAGVLSATWGQTGPGSGSPYDVPVRSGGQVLGGITVLVPEGRTLRPADARLLQALADQAAMAFRNTALATQLTERVEQLDRTTQQLSESRARLVDASDDARRALEAAISREVLPRLSFLPGRIATTRAAPDLRPEAAAPLLSDTNSALESLRELTRGVYPTQLSRVGLAPALRARLGQAGLASILEVEDSAADRRFAPRVERAVYFCCAEAAPALSDRSVVLLHADERGLRLHLGGVAVGRVDLQAVADRVAAADGSLTSADDELTVWVPTDQSGAPEEGAASAHASASRSGPNAALGT